MPEIDPSKRLANQNIAVVGKPEVNPNQDNVFANQDDKVSAKERIANLKQELGNPNSNDANGTKQDPNAKATEDAAKSKGREEDIFNERKFKVENLAAKLGETPPKITKANVMQLFDKYVGQAKMLNPVGRAEKGIKARDMMLTDAVTIDQGGANNQAGADGGSAGANSAKADQMSPQEKIAELEDEMLDKLDKKDARLVQFHQLSQQHELGFSPEEIEAGGPGIVLEALDKKILQEAESQKNETDAVAANNPIAGLGVEKAQLNAPMEKANEGKQRAKALVADL
jgi:hypothetical protein